MTNFLNPLPAEQNLRMTSTQIAELCGVEHATVLRSIDRLLEEIESESLNSDGVESEFVNIVIEAKDHASVRYFDLNEDASIAIAIRMAFLPYQPKRLEQTK